MNVRGNLVEKKDRPYSVEPHNPEWKKKFQEEKKVLEEILGDTALQIEHVGSTSVEGLWVKPQIDVLVVVNDLASIDKCREKLESAGYNYHSDFDQYNERYFTRDAPSGERLVSVHISPADNERALSALYFRDYLRAHPKDRELYGSVKRKAHEAGVDRVQYSKEKRDTLLAIKERAEKWHSAEGATFDN